MIRLSHLRLANKLFSAGHYALAIEEYRLAATELPNLFSSISFNIQLAKFRLSQVNGDNAIRFQGCSLAPGSELIPSITKENVWHANGGDPYFFVEPLPGSDFMAGWYLIQLEVFVPETAIVYSKLYIDYGSGFSEENVQSLITHDGVNSVVVNFRANPARLRLDPIDFMAEIEVRCLNIEKIEYAVALESMISRIVFMRNSQLEGDGRQAISITDVHVEIEAISKELEIPFTEALSKEYQKVISNESIVIGYQTWIRLIENPSLPDYQGIQKMIASFEILPLISVIMPTYNTDEYFLRCAIDSVIKQSYPNWELCIADDASTSPRVRFVLEEYASLDGRIKVHFRDENGHISLASNSALELATGEYVALFDHDDMLAKHALLFVAESVNLVRDALIIYSDEDKLMDSGCRAYPHFKSDWNPNLIYSNNYVSHLCVYKKSLLDRIGGFRPGYEGAQDYDLLLRSIDHAEYDQIIHIPKVLYHWRIHADSTASSSDAKSYTVDAGLRALQDYFLVKNINVEVKALDVPNVYRVMWPLPSLPPLISLLIPTRDHVELIKNCVNSILDKTTYENYEIIILDNASVEVETLHFFKEIQARSSRVSVLSYNHEFNYSAINNFGVSHSRGEIIGLINNDIEVINPGWLTEMVSHVIRPEIGCVGAKLYYADDTIQHAGVILSLGGVAGHGHRGFSRHDPGYFSRLISVQNLSAVTAACLLVRRNIFDAVGGLDEFNLTVAFNDVDFCMKVAALGYLNLWTPFSELYHYESISRGSEDTQEKRQRFAAEVNFMISKWGERLDADRFYNPNLTKIRQDFSIANC